MSSNDRQRVPEKQLQAEIEQLRSDLRETVETLAHKTDVPARVKERDSEPGARAIKWGNAVKAQVAGRGSEWRDQALTATERTREAVSQTPPDRWAKLASAALAVIAVLVLIRRVRAS